jgi:coenzyme F420-0:L-glutamate ligase/coenzyme F420-1:gamma-L-glutamate ligase
MNSAPFNELRVVPLGGLPEIEEGADLAAMIGDALVAAGLQPVDGDILVVTSKIVSKAEGRRIAATDREDAITAETVRVVATRSHPGGITRIVENRQGLVQAAAGVDASNTPEGTVLLLPVDPDASARGLAGALRTRFGVRVGVIISDTLGRAWREGQVDMAIGAAGVLMLDDLRGSRDSFGHELLVTQAAIGDELASAGDLVKGKASGMPVAVVRGFAHAVVDTLDTPARALSRTGENDMFRLGTDEAIALGREQARAEPAFRSLALRDLRRPHFVDLIAVPLPPGVTTDPRVWAETMFSPRSIPLWVRVALGLRQRLVRFTGIPPAPRDTFAVDEVVGEEALIAADDVHLDFRCAVGVDAVAGLVRVTTAVRLKNARGRFYFVPVRPLHPIVVRAMLVRAAHRLMRSTRTR